MRMVIGTLFMLVLLMGMVGCTPTNEDITNRFSLPPELDGYKIVTLSTGSGLYLYVLVKKGEEDREVIGTMLPGKVPVHTIVIDGEVYGKLEK